MRVAWDIDGVLYPFVDELVIAYNNEFNENIDINEIYNSDELPYELEEWKCFNKDKLKIILSNPRKYGLYTQRNSHWEDKSFIENLNYLITSRNSYNGIGSDTIRWLNYFYYSEDLPQVIIANHFNYASKAKMCDLFDIEVLIEDNLEVLIDSLNRSSTLLFGIIFDRPWNRKLYVRDEKTGGKKEIPIPKNIKRVYSLQEILDMNIC